MSGLDIVFVSAIAVNTAIGVVLFMLWLHAANRMSRIKKMQHDMTSSSRGDIQQNRKDIVVNRESIEVP